MMLHLIGETPRHGYDIIRALSEKTGGAYAPSPGMIYPMLTMLTEIGLTEETDGGGRKTFALTDAGRAELAERRAEADSLIARLESLADVAARIDPAPVRRAMDGLRAALKAKLSRDDADPAWMDQAVDLIDNLTRKIEKL